MSEPAQSRSGVGVCAGGAEDVTMGGRRNAPVEATAGGAGVCVGGAARVSDAGTSAGARSGRLDGAQAELRSRILLQSAASAMSIKPTEIAAVHVTELGAVDVRGTMEVEREHRLEAMLQANREFLSLYREAQENWADSAGFVATLQTYA